ncbi:hypothetical protein [Rodentibacter heidelbergensis]|nr:hypothetical protein [Rodentibacter heidelbergensis]
MVTKNTPKTDRTLFFTINEIDLKYGLLTPSAHGQVTDLKSEKE